MVVSVVLLKVLPDKEEKFEALIESVLPMILQERGTLQYTLHRSQEGPGRYLFYGKYASKADHDEHRAQPYVEEMIKKASAWCIEPPSISFYEEILPKAL
jgi:quinol monooxygenase YgiN